MPEAYSKLCEIYTMTRHTENPGKFRTVYSGLFRQIQEHSAILSHFRHIEGH